jgi:hypothetical protein
MSDEYYNWDRRQTEQFRQTEPMSTVDKEEFAIPTHIDCDLICEPIQQPNPIVEPNACLPTKFLLCLISGPLEHLIHLVVPFQLLPERRS